MPSASATMATTVKPGFFSSILKPYRKSLRKVSIATPPRPVLDAPGQWKEVFSADCLTNFRATENGAQVPKNVRFDEEPRLVVLEACAAVGKSNLRIRNMCLR